MSPKACTGTSEKIAFTEKYVKSFDGTKLYYNVIGEGFPIALSDGIACDMYAWKYIVEQFSPHCKILRWNYRGHGRSEKPADLNNLSVENCADDLAIVMEDAGMESAVHIGHSMGVQVILEFFRRHPDKVDALVPLCGSYGHPLRTFHDSDMFDRLFPLVYEAVLNRPKEVVDTFWKKIVPSKFAYWVALFTEINRHLVKEPDFMPYLEHVAKLDLELFVRMLKYAKDHSARDVLPTINVPTLIFGAEHDTFTPAWLSRDMQKLIPGAEFQFLPMGSHTAPIEHPDLIGLRFDKFLRENFSGDYDAKSRRKGDQSDAHEPRHPIRKGAKKEEETPA